jgi:pre-mRNA-splicing factor ATP-dependent RNA helicase DHX38/PRP16
LASLDADESRKRPRLDSGDDAVFKVPALPSRSNIRQRGDETPSHPGGLSDTARKRLEEHRRNREQQREGLAVRQERRDDAPRGIGDFQRRSNQARDRGWSERRDERREGRGWDSTPRTERGRDEDAPSVRVPNRRWDETPRGRDGDRGGWGGARDRRWDAPTPRASRGGSPGEDGADATGLDMREWEEEQIRLDRDWYSGAEEGAMVGDEDHNPLAQYEDLSTLKQAEIETKRVKKISAKQAQYVRTPLLLLVSQYF